MAIRSVGFQLRTDGKAEVRNDFAEMRAAGAAAVNGVADAAEAAGERTARATEGFAQRQIDAWKRQANAAKLAASAQDSRAAFDAALGQSGNSGQFATVNLDRSSGAAKEAASVFLPMIEAEEKLEARTRALLTAIDPTWAAQERFNREITEATSLFELGRLSTDQYALAQERAHAQLDVSTGATRRAAEATAALIAMQARVDAAGDNGMGGWAGSAERSAAAFRGLIAEQEQLERRVNTLRSAIDPAYAAQQRFNAEIGEARALISQGEISLDDYVAKLRIEQAALDAVTAAHGRGTVSDGQARQSKIMLGQQLQDFSVQVVSGQSVATAFAQQIGQAAFAIQGMGGKLEGVATFLASGWGIALTIALTVLAPLVSKLFEGNNALDEAIDKLKKDAAASEINRQAKMAFAHSVEGVAAAIRDSTEATRKSIEADKSAAEQNNINARANLIEETSIRNKTAARLADARAILEAEIRASRAGGERGEVATLGVAGKQAQVDAISRELADQTKLVGEAQANLERSRLALAAEQGKADARARTDPIARINKLYDDQVAALDASKAAAIARGGTIGALSKREYDDIERNRQAALKAEQERQAASSRTQNQIGRNVTLSEARDIASSIGARVTSDHRSRSEQEALYARYKAGTGSLAAKPGTSYHELDQALDIAKTEGMTLAKIVAAYRQAGVKLVEALDEGNHFHVAWKKTGEAAQAATDQRKELAKQARDAAAANRDLDNDLREVVGAYDPARAAAESYAAELKKIDALVTSGRLTIDQANTYRTVAWHNEQTRAAEEQLAAFKRLFGNDDPMAEAVASGQRNIAASAAAGAEDLDAKIKITAAAMDELRGYGANFVDTVLSEDTWSSWGNAGKTVLASLKNEFIKLAVLNPLKNLINGDSALPTLSSAIGNIGKLFGGKATTPSVGTTGLLGGNATGTESWSGGLTYVNENGGEIMDLPGGTRIYPAAESRRMMAANDAGSGRVAVDINLNTDLFTAAVSQIAGSQVQAAAPAIAAGAASMSSAQDVKRRRRRLPGS